MNKKVVLAIIVLTSVPVLKESINLYSLKSKDFYQSDLSNPFLPVSRDPSSNEGNFTAIVPVFMADAEYSGRWTYNPSILERPLFNNFKSTSGIADIEFFVETSKNLTRVRVGYYDDEFMDGKKAWLIFNLTKADPNYISKSLFIVNPKITDEEKQYRIYVGDSMLNHETNISYDASIIMNLTSIKNHSKYNLEVDDINDLRITVDLYIRSLDLSLNTIATLKKETSSFWSKDAIYIGACLLLIAVNVFSTNRIDRMDVNIPSLDNMGFVSTLILAALYFQYFGFFIMMLLSNDEKQTMMLLATCLALVVHTSTSYKTAFLIFLHRYDRHPLIDQNNLRSPKGKFLLFSMILIMLSYICTVVYVRHHSYSLILIAYNCFPLVKIIESTIISSKNCFNFYIHVMSWLPCLFFGALIRGFRNDLVKMKPYPTFVPLVASVYLFGMIMSYLQKRCGPRFFLPKSCRPGIHQLYIKKRDLPEELLEKECVICLNSLKLTQEEISIIEADKGSPLVGEVELIKTQCGHHFHADCFINWMSVKKECPTCRERIKAF